jgi:hypothetical protein
MVHGGAHSVALMLWLLDCGGGYGLSWGIKEVSILW